MAESTESTTTVTKMRRKPMRNPEATYSTGRTGAQALIDVGNAKVVSDYAKPLVDAGAHPLQALMSLHVIYSLSHKAKKPAPVELKK